MVDCKFEDCDRPHNAKGYCLPHYKQMRNGGVESLRPLRDRRDPLCAFPGCGRPNRSRGYCESHRKQITAGGVESLRPLRRVAPERTCRFEGCDRHHYGNGFCAAHNSQWNARGRDESKLTPIIVPREHGPTCEFPGCDRPYQSEGYCGSHLRQLKRWGKEKMRPIKDVPGVGAEHVDAPGYVRIKLSDTGPAKSRWMYKHRYVMQKALGRKLLKGEIVHHRDGDKQNNDIRNLALCVNNRQPPNQLVEDVVAWAVKMLRRYAPDKLVASERDGPLE